MARRDVWERTSLAILNARLKTWRRSRSTLSELRDGVSGNQELDCGLALGFHDAILMRLIPIRCRLGVDVDGEDYRRYFVAGPANLSRAASSTGSAPWL